MERITRSGAASWGQEASFKIVGGRLLGGRTLLALRTGDLPPDGPWTIAAELGIPAPALTLLRSHERGSNAVFFGVEDRPEGPLLKVYLEFWDAVRADVKRTGSREPRLLHLGVKWDAGSSRFEVARYLCHPLLSAREVLRRVADLTPGGGSEACRSILLQGLKARPAAAFVYLDVSEEGNARRSFDVNVYQSGLLVRDVAPTLLEAAGHFRLAAGSIDQQLVQLGSLPLGHVSGGVDRAGREFLSIYAEVRPLASH